MGTIGSKKCKSTSEMIEYYRIICILMYILYLSKT